MQRDAPRFRRTSRFRRAPRHAIAICGVIAALALRPAWGASSTPGGTPGLRLTYALYGHGLHVMQVTAAFRMTAEGYSVSLDYHTTGFAGMFVRSNVRSAVVGSFAGDAVEPTKFTSSGYSRGAQRSAELDYTDGDPHVAVLTPVDRNRDPVAPEATRHSIDTLSAMAMLLRDVVATHRCDGHATLFDGQRLSTLTAVTAGQDAVPKSDRSPYDGMALRCNFVGLETGGFLHDEYEARSRQPMHGSAWLAQVIPDAPPLPIRIGFENPQLGYANMYLVSVAKL